MDRPILLDAKYVRPASLGKETTVCAKCLRDTARWKVGKAPNDHFCCAHCFLYATPWGVEHAEQIKELVAETEAAIGKKISTEGFVAPYEADRILQAIVLVSKIKMRAQMPGAGCG